MISLQKCAAVAVTGLMVFGNSSAWAQSDPPAVQNNYRSFYDAAITCFVANGHARGLRQRAGDEAKAAVYDDKAHAALGLATTAGHTLGLSDEQIKAAHFADRGRAFRAMVGADFT